VRVDLFRIRPAKRDVYGETPDVCIEFDKRELINEIVKNGRQADAA